MVLEMASGCVDLNETRTRLHCWMEGILKTPCPECGGDLRELSKAVQCVKCDFSIWKMMAGRPFEAAEMETLIRERQLGPLRGFRGKMGESFTAIIKLNAENKAEFD